MASNRRTWFGTGLVACALVVSPVHAQKPNEFAAALQMYLDGDYAAAETALRPQIDRGEAKAMSLLALMQVSELVEGDPEPLLTRASALDDPEAQFQLSGIVDSAEERMRLLDSSSGQGHPHAAFFFGEALRKQGASPEDFIPWLRLAESRGQKDAWGARIILTMARDLPLDYIDVQVADTHILDGSFLSYLAYGHLKFYGTIDEAERDNAMMWLVLSNVGEEILPEEIRSHLAPQKEQVSARADGWLARLSRILKSSGLAAVSAWCHENHDGSPECLRRAAEDDSLCPFPFFPSVTVERYRNSVPYSECREYVYEVDEL